MTFDLILVGFFAATIHGMGVLALSVRIVGVRTGRLVLSLALFNIMALVSRTASSFQTPLLANHIETTLVGAGAPPTVFRGLLAVAFLGSLSGALAVPTFQRVFTPMVELYARKRRFSVVLRQALQVSASSRFLRLPTAAHLRTLRRSSSLPLSLLVLHTLAVALLSTGIFSALYAGVLEPGLRATCIALSGVVHGGATLLLFISVDPAVALASEEALAGSTSEAGFRRGIVQLVASRVIGVALAQLFLVPGAVAIIAAARWL